MLDRGDRLHPHLASHSGVVLRRLATEVGRAADALGSGRGRRALDLGCGNMPYRPLFEARGWTYVGADLPGNPEAVITLAEDGGLPESAGKFDAGLSFQVLEHALDPAAYLARMRDALQPGAPLLLSTHGLWPYHPDPGDYWRWTRDGLAREVSRAGFEVDGVEPVLGPISASAQFLATHLRWQLPSVLGAAAAAVLQPIIALGDLADGPRTARRDAAVFVVVAHRPAGGGPA